jgi:hypothetical protein
VTLRSLKAELDEREVSKAWEIEEALDRRFFRPVAIHFTGVFHRLGGHA